ncbi:2Fe-2S iron-sulfur cluster-binding protein [Pseudidiomarina terrestris]|uniref:2Fe-2S iron-sulfur cluster-binding protein n=1 Tax=Pseudidiomarina terrestris TaxID=2820060 RepID=UPI002652B6CF|nr:2Fe-2S iron-sulfur cluster-binding protein [Pseudidiomarina sp. 1ASP75-5]MDN7134962.1 2Fe-2S iron-sulfur cluster binding domain-containing protein [Pseudidiomarina sp. 1ASP75-5]
MPKAIFIDKDGGQYEADIPVGQSLMEGAVDNMIDGILGECGGVMSCATCHCYVAKEWEDKLPPASEREEDMLDMAIEPQDNSRLSCQIEMTEELDGITVYLPPSQF